MEMEDDFVLVDEPAVDEWKMKLVEAGLDESDAHQYGMMLAGKGGSDDKEFMASLNHKTLQSYGVCLNINQ